MKHIRNIWLICLLLSSASLFAQPGPDEKARELVSLGKKQFYNNQWKDAANSFELATQRPENSLSSFAWYMAGMSYYNQAVYEKAEQNFAMLAKAYPGSKYLEEAQYHRGLILLESSRVIDRDKGMELMFKTMEQSSNTELRANAEKALRSYAFYKYDHAYLTLCRTLASDAYKMLFTEAICYNLDKKGEGPKALAEIKDVTAKGGTLTPYLSALKAKLESGRSISASRLNIAVVLSFHADRADTASYVPTKSLNAIEMFEGMMMALDSIGPSLRKELNVRVFDSRADTNHTRILLDSLNRFNPDIIVGDVRTNVSTIVSAWAEKNKVLHIIPRNPLNELISGKKYTFLAHPSLATHGSALAEYMVKTLGKRSVAVFNDKTFYSEKLSQAFAETARANGASVSLKPISKEPAKLKGEASIEAKNIKTAGTEVVYVPLSNEESAGMIMSYLNYHSAKPIVVGGPDWEAFNIIDPELKTSFQLKYTTLFYDKNDSLAGINLHAMCGEQYSYEPTNNTIMGYDIMAWVLEVGRDLSTYQDPAQAVHKAALYHGIHQDMYFGDHQDNQRVNIVQFTKGRVDKVSHD